MDRQVLKELNREREARRAAVLLTDLDSGEMRLVREGDEVTGDVSEAIEAAFRSGRSRTVEADGRRFFLNAHVPPPRLVVVGAVHISQAMVPIAAEVGFDLTVIDPRTAFATADRFPNTRLFAEWPEDILAEHPLDAYSALAALTHDPKIDDLALKAALDENCFYVGALGSRKTHARRVERLSSMGLSERAIGRIHAPIGLDIGAASPAEIGVAVMAEVIRALRTRDGSVELAGGGKAA